MLIIASGPDQSGKLSLMVTMEAHLPRLTVQLEYFGVHG